MFGSLIRTIKLQKISKRLARPIDFTHLSRYSKNESSDHDIALEQLIDLCYKDKTLVKLIESNELDREILQDIYHVLCSSGAGQSVLGHYVPASSLFYPQTLLFILTFFKDGQFIVNNLSPKDSALEISYRLIRYFETADVGVLNL